MKSRRPWYVWLLLTFPEVAVFVLVGYGISWVVAGVIFGLSYGFVSLLALKVYRRRRRQPSANDSS